MSKTAGETPPANLKLKPCRVCNRTFAPEALTKHEPICKKNAGKDRGVFDSGKQRAAGTDIPEEKTLRPGEKPAHETTSSNWRAEHEEFIATVRAAREPPPEKSPAGAKPGPAPAMSSGQPASKKGGKPAKK